ncbi:NTP transferase domain-containing protein [Paenibacillus sp. CC-CFT747]|nr:NTP transferase domain-containing protein [Paenibacillus sp. CC-CFT747]
MVRDRGRVFGVFLAAGRSRRMGRPKLELPFREGTLGSTALAAACGSALDGIFVITGDTAAPAWLPQDWAAGPDRSRVHMVPCKDAEHGQAFSLRCGVEAALRHGAEAVVVLLGDQPLLTSSAINRLLDEYHGLSDEKGRPAFIAASRAGEGCRSRRSCWTPSCSLSLCG